MLVGNYSVLQKSPGRFVGGSTTSVEGQVRSNFSKSGSYRNRFYVDQTTVALSLYAIPTGTYPDIAWVLPQKAGQIASTQPIQGAGTQTANISGGLSAEAGLDGAGNITSAVAQLIISMAASLAGDGTISAADLRGYLQASATLSGFGDLAAFASPSAWITSDLSGAGTISVATSNASGSMSANILSYGALTPEGIRDAVWNAIAANYDLNATMGELLHNAAAGGGGGGGGLTLGQFLALQNP